MAKDYMGIGIGGAFLGIAFSIPVLIYRDGKEEVGRMELEKAKVEKGYLPQERDLNNNSLPERFFEVDGQKYFLAVDGKNIEDTLRE